MIFAFSEEHEELRRAVRRFLADSSPMPAVRRLMETEAGYDPAAWSVMADQLGLQGLLVPEELGGSGSSFLEVALVLEEMGRVLCCSPYLSTALATGAVLASGDQGAASDLLPGIAAGETIATVALVEDSGRFDLDGVATEARRAGGGFAVDGVKSFVSDGAVADLLLVAARSPAGLCLLAVDRRTPGVEVTPLSGMDQTRKLARVDLRGAPGRLVGEEGGAGPVLGKTLDLAAVALSAEATGGAQACLDMSVEYAKNRVQFGRAIGSFQAIKHKCANMLVEVEHARSAAYYAAWAAALDPDELPVAASLAKAYCTEAFFHAAAETIQIHGGIGFTWEHDAHLYFKRAKYDELYLGDPAYHREQLAQRIGI
jgi:alkylation response protein AidB-like acyl-CoA dehydrogenase